MAPPDHERGRPPQETGPGKLATKLATEPRIPHAEMFPTPAGPVADVEAVAIALADRFGPTWCRRLAHELLEVAGELLADRRTVWGGGER